MQYPAYNFMDAFTVYITIGRVALRFFNDAISECFEYSWIGGGAFGKANT